MLRYALDASIAWRTQCWKDLLHVCCSRHCSIRASDENKADVTYTAPAPEPASFGDMRLLFKSLKKQIRSCFSDRFLVNARLERS